MASGSMAPACVRVIISWGKKMKDGAFFVSLVGGKKRGRATADSLGRIARMKIQSVLYLSDVV